MVDRLVDQVSCSVSDSVPVEVDDNVTNVGVDVQVQPQASESEDIEGENDEEDKEALITEILELQNTLHDLSQRVHSVKEENEQLQVDNQVCENG